MSVLSDLFTEEARIIDPEFQRYLAAPSQTTAAQYLKVAMPWLGRAQTALQAPGANQDPWSRNVAPRFDVVVKNTNRIREDGNEPQGPGFWDHFKKELPTLPDVEDAAKKARNALIAAVVILGLLVILTRKF